MVKDYCRSMTNPLLDRLIIEQLTALSEGKKVQQFGLLAQQYRELGSLGFNYSGPLKAEVHLAIVSQSFKLMLYDEGI